MRIAENVTFNIFMLYTVILHQRILSRSFYTKILVSADLVLIANRKQNQLRSENGFEWYLLWQGPQTST